MEMWKSQVVRAQHGEVAAFDAIVARFERMAVGYAFTILGDFTHAEDAAQEAFIDAFLCLPHLQHPAAFPAWLRKIIFKHCDRIMRRTSIATLPLELAHEIPDPALSPLEILSRQERQAQVLAAVTALPEQEKTVITLAYIGGYSQTEVSAFLGVPVSTVKNRLHAARKHLKERMIGMVEDTLKSQPPGDEFRREITKVLEGIEQIHWRNSAPLCFVGSTVASMHFLHDPVTTEYVMGISGGAFMVFWHPDWSESNCDILNLRDEPVRRTFTALGYAYEFQQLDDQAWEDIMARKAWAETRARYREVIVAAIDAGKPVMVQGVVGPPECCVVAGYEEDGRILYGRSYFSDQGNYFRQEDWYALGVILLGEKRTPPSTREVLRGTLHWALRLGHEPLFASLPHASAYNRQRLNGLAAYDGMCDALLRDEDFPAGDLETLTFRSMALGNDGICLLHANRQHAAAFCSRMAREENVPALQQAAGCYAQEVEVLTAANALTPHTCSPESERLALADPGRRHQLDEFMRTAKEHEERALGHLAHAYHALTF